MVGTGVQPVILENGAFPYCGIIPAKHPAMASHDASGLDISGDIQADALTRISGWPDVGLVSGVGSMVG